MDIKDVFSSMFGSANPYGAAIGVGGQILGGLLGNRRVSNPRPDTRELDEMINRARELGDPNSKSSKMFLNTLQRRGSNLANNININNRSNLARMGINGASGVANQQARQLMADANNQTYEQFSSGMIDRERTSLEAGINLSSIKANLLNEWQNNNTRQELSRNQNFGNIVASTFGNTYNSAVNSNKKDLDFSSLFEELKNGNSDLMDMLKEYLKNNSKSAVTGRQNFDEYYV